jgi:hypothetical protein
MLQSHLVKGKVELPLAFLGEKGDTFRPIGESIAK